MKLQTLPEALEWLWQGYVRLMKIVRRCTSRSSARRGASSRSSSSTTDDGSTGVGEVRMVEQDRDARRLHRASWRRATSSAPIRSTSSGSAWNVQRADYGRPGEVTQSALAAFDIACWDLIGQALGVPVWKLLGGKFRDRVPAYANGWYQAERDPSAIAELAARRSSRAAIAR